MTRRPAIRHLLALSVLMGALVGGSSGLAAGSAASSGVIIVSPTGVTRSVDVQTFPRKTTLPVVDLSLSPSGRGYVTLDLGGSITSYGDAPSFSRQSFPSLLALPTAIVLTKTGRGAYVGFLDGTVRALGDAPSVGGPAGGRAQLLPPLVDIALAPNGKGLWALRANGAVQELGGVPALPDAPSGGSVATGIAATPSGEGAWVARINGSVVALGDAEGARGARSASEPRVSDIASLGDQGWALVDLAGRVEPRGSTPTALPGSGSGFVAIDTLAATSVVTGAGDGAPVSTKVIDPAAILDASGDPAGTLAVTVPCYLTGGPTPLVVGDVLAASIGEHTPNGLLRKVLSIGACANGALVVDTEPATLAEAMPEGEVSFSSDLSDIELPDLEPTTEDGFVEQSASSLVFGQQRASGPQVAAAGAVGTFADPGRFTYGCPSDPDEGGFELKAKPAFSYDPDVIFEADWDIDSEEVHLRTGFGMQGDLSIELTATGSIVCDASFAILSGFSLGTKVLFVGPVPIVVEPQLSLLANLEGKAEGALATTASVTGSISSALRVDVVSGSASHSLDSSALVTGNLGASFQAKVEATFALEPSMGFLLYGLVAPTAKLSAGAKATFEPCANPNLKLEAPLTFRAKVEPSQWLGELLEPLENLDLSVENEFNFPGSPYLLKSQHISTPLPCEQTTTLPGATTGQPYSQQLAVQIPDGATSPVYAVAGGSSLPDGLSLSPSGLLSGTPTQAGVYSFTVNVGHSLGSSSERFQLSVIEDSLRILTESLPGAELDAPYLATLTANRPADELVWTISSGSLPPGITLDPGGAFSGTPTEAGLYSFTVRVEHTDDGTVEKPLSIAVQRDGMIAFTSNRDLNDWDIYVINPDGSGEQQLTFNTVDDVFPSWSPDRTKIAFQRSLTDPAAIWVMNADGSQQTKLTSTGSTRTFDWMPSWSPDGTRIVFTSYRDGNGEIYVMNADGSGQTRLTNTPYDEQSASWSPDGTKIAYTGAYVNGDEFGIYVMNTDGSGQTRLTTNVGLDDSSPAWSPEGSRIAFDHGVAFANREIHVMNADGSDRTALTSTTRQDGEPSWSPDGAKIAFWSDRDLTGGEIYVMNADGSGQTRLTNEPGPGQNASPSWSP